MARAGRSRHTRLAALHLALPLLTLGLFLLTPAGCGSRGAVEPGTLVYEGPQTYTLKPGDPLPGTDIRYIGPTGQGAEFEVAGQRALKQKADSLNWSGSPADGVKLDLRLRIAWFTEDALYTVGTLRLAVAEVDPQAAGYPAGAPLSYQAPVTYAVKRGGTVPGTTVSFEGKEADGARFGGVEGYALRQAGDSLLWDGRLRPNVALREELRLVHFDERSARFVGVARISILP